MTKSKPVSTIYHKSSCITCKKTISEIERLKVDIQKRDFFEEPFSESELKKIVKLSGLSSFDLLRKRDKMFKELKLDSVNSLNILSLFLKRSKELKPESFTIFLIF